MYRSAFLKLSSALLLTAFAALSACQSSQTASKPQAREQSGGQAKAPAPQPSPEAQILADEAMLRKPYAVLGGSVQNVGKERLSGLVVEMELRRRSDGSTERREIAVQPADLAPGEQGKYSLKVLSNDWASFRVARLKSGARTEEVAYQLLPGAKRPPERTPDGKEIIVKSPSKTGPGGEEFINTPDTATRVP
ncbi:MAG TPA: hypothetical protein VGX48_03965 [Pyrinomonadaceae bacterium]|jgi:hypothetical protein|nr:hypothetical protein [Pyrinomonadaceae bacterium]